MAPYLYLLSINYANFGAFTTKPTIKSHICLTICCLGNLRTASSTAIIELAQEPNSNWCLSCGECLSIAPVGICPMAFRSSAVDMTWPVVVPCLLGRGRRHHSGGWQRVSLHCNNCVGAATVTCSCAGGVRTQREFQHCEWGRWWLGLSHIRQQCSDQVTQNVHVHGWTATPVAFIRLLSFPQNPPQMCQCTSIPWRKLSLASAPPFTLRAGLCVRCNDVHLQIEICRLITVSRWTVNRTTTTRDSR